MKSRLLFIKDKTFEILRKRKEIVVAIFLIAGMISFFMMNDFQSKDEYYDIASDTLEATADSGKISVYMSIDCKNILKHTDNIKDYDTMKDFIPENGIILDKTEYQIDEESTAFDLLEMVTRANQIQLDYQGATSNIYGSVYVKGIGHIYEKSCGSSSGWMYMVNGEWVGSGCNNKKLKDGDTVQWRFTCDGGKDLK